MRPLDIIRGRCVVFGAQSVPIAHESGDGQFIETISEGAPHWYSTCTANYHHAGETAFANITDGTLRMWADRWGVSFEADIPRTPHGAGIRNMLASGEWGVSPLLTIYSPHNGVDRKVSRCRIDHISITNSPAYPATAAWLASMPVNRLHPHARDASLRWNLGKLNPTRAEVPNPEFEYDPALNDHIQMSNLDREARYAELLEIAARNERRGITA